MKKSITIDGRRIHDIPTFYDEINRVFMSGEDWKIGPSLDALNDLFYGGFGKLKGNEAVKLIWKNFEQNRLALGPETTKPYYREKLDHPTVFNTGFVKQKLSELENGTGQTYFDIILEIIGEHRNIELVTQ